MKNIHLLPTDKPSRLKQNKITKKLSIVNKGIDLTAYIPIDIYITSDEEIKEGDWFLPISGIGWKLNIPIKADGNGGYHNEHCKKIILTLTTDQSLDCVQSIDYEFLEWFINNPSCEEIEVEKEIKSIQLPQQQLSENSYSLDFRWVNKQVYKIIIPKEEHRQENCCTPVGQIKRYVDCKGCDRKPKQETLEETAKNAYKKHSVKDDALSLDEQIQRSGGFIVGFKEGAEWQEEQDKLKQITQLEEIVSKLEEDGLYALQGIKDVIEKIKNG